MKTSKRILGIALAVIMIFNVFAVGVFAAFPDDSVAKLVIDTDKDVYAPGDVITLKISAQVIEEIGTMALLGQYEIAFPSAAVEPLANSDVLEDHGFVPFDASYYDSSIATVQMNPEPQANLEGTDDNICYVLGGDTLFPATELTEIFTVQMKIKEDAPNGTYTIGFNPAGYDEYNAYITDGMGLGGLYGNIGADLGFAQEYVYDLGSVTFTVGAAEEKIIFEEKQQYQISTLTDGDDFVNLGFVGYFDADDIGGLTTKENNRSITNVTKVGVKVTFNGVTNEYTTDYVYIRLDGKYNYRAIFTDFDYVNYGDAAIEVTYFMDYYNADGVEVRAESETVPTTANTIIYN